MKYIYRNSCKCVFYCLYPFIYRW